MLDKDLFKLLDDKRDIAKVITVSILGLVVNMGITACICWVIGLAYKGEELRRFATPIVLLIVGVLLRMSLSIIGGRIRASLGAKVKKQLRQKVYDKTLKLGLKSVEGMNIAGLTQVSIEGVEQLDLYYSSY
ncbi:MAG: hypothetical protein K2L53_00340, partial [Clostridia bacterium]|nr:hypothetical protein [Clostridia bacterium]